MRKRARKRKKVDTIEKLAILTANGFSESSDRFDGVDAELYAIRAEVADIYHKIDLLEEQGARQAGYSKEIDHLLGRMSRIEKHLKFA